MYKWPQGKVLRMVLLILTLVVAGDLGWQCYGEVVGIMAQHGGDAVVTWQRYVIVGILGLASLAALLGGIVCIAFLPRTVDRLIEVEYEMTKVTWPTQNEVVRSTVIITIMTVILASLIFAVDWVNYAVVVEQVLQQGG